MSALVCSISGSPLVQGVVSSKSGHLYEKSTISHYIARHGTCPHTGSPLAPQDLVDLAGSNTHVLPSQSNVPALSLKMGSEFDALVLQTHMLKQQLREKREELATSLYRQDASIRVIARLQEERDAQRKKMAEIMEQIREEEGNKQ